MKFDQKIPRRTALATRIYNLRSASRFGTPRHEVHSRQTLTINANQQRFLSVNIFPNATFS